MFEEYNNIIYVVASACGLHHSDTHIYDIPNTYM